MEADSSRELAHLANVSLFIRYFGGGFFVRKAILTDISESFTANQRDFYFRLFFWVACIFKWKRFLETV